MELIIDTSAHSKDPQTFCKQSKCGMIQEALTGQELLPLPRPRSGSEKKSPPSKMQTKACKRAACGLAAPPYHRAKP